MKFLHRQPFKSLMTIDPWEEAWPDYVTQYGFNGTHVPQLIQLATYIRYLWAAESADEYWLPVHAWRTLGQLKAEAAVHPLLGQLDSLEDVGHHYAMEEIPIVLGQIGEVSLHPVAAYLADARHSLWARVVVTATLTQLAKWYPELTRQSALIGATQLASFSKQSRELNGLLIAELVDLGAIEHIEVINAAFRADQVDLSVIGDWQEVHIRLGLLDERLTPPVPWQLVSNQSEFIEWRRLAATAYKGEDTLSRFLRAYHERELLGNVN